MAVKTIENHRVLTVTNELQIDGHHLIEANSYQCLEQIYR